MKSLEELAAIRESMKKEIVIREGEKDMRVLVGMGEAGLESGAREVLKAFVAEVAKEGLAEKCTVRPSAYVETIGGAPTVEVVEAGKDKVTYVNMTAEKAARVVSEHIKNGNPVAEYTR